MSTFWIVLFVSGLFPQTAVPPHLPSSRPARTTPKKHANTSSVQPSKKAAQPTSRKTSKVDKRVRVAGVRLPLATLKKKPLLRGDMRPPADIATRAKAQPKTLQPTFNRIRQGSFFWTQLIGMLFALFVVILVIYVLLRWAAQRMGVAGIGGTKLLRVCDRLSLEPKKGLWVVEAAGEYLLIATHEQGVTLLERLDAKTIREKQAESIEPTGFWERLRPTPSMNEAHSSQPKSEQIPTQFEVVSDGKSTDSTTT